jgi:hypothetical protein
MKVQTKSTWCIPTDRVEPGASCVEVDRHPHEVKPAVITMRTIVYLIFDGWVKAIDFSRDVQLPRSFTVHQPVVGAVCGEPLV